jgi:hypothetical protein
MVSKLSLSLVCLNFPLRDKILKNSFEVAEGLEFSFSYKSASWQQTLPTRGNYLSFLFPLGLIWAKGV